METLKTIWDFFQNEILGMAWLNRLIGSLLNALGLDTNEKNRRKCTVLHLRYDKNYGAAWHSHFHHLVYSELLPA